MAALLCTSEGEPLLSEGFHVVNDMPEADDSLNPSGSDSAEADPRHPRNIRGAAKLTMWLGIAHALLLISATLLFATRVPAVNASDEELSRFYNDPDERRAIVIVGLYLIPLAGITFIWFFVALRMWVSSSARRENILFSNVQLVAGIIYTTLLFAAGASISVIALNMETSSAPFDPQAGRTFPQYGLSLLLVLSMRMAAMFVLTTANIGRFSRLLPKWFTLISYVVAVGLLLTASVNSLLILVFPGWILAFCFILLNRIRRIPSDVHLGDATPRQALEAMRG